VIRLVRAATYVSVSTGSYTVPKASGASMPGQPAPPIAIGTVGRISRSQDHTESKPDPLGILRDLRDDLR